jgi:signal transduction histidine kinase
MAQAQEDAQARRRSGKSGQSPGNAGLVAPMPRAVVHELRTPLTAIHGYAQLLQRGLSDPAVSQRAVDVILRETTRLSGLLSALSEVAELDSGAFPFDPVDVDMVPVVRGAAERARARADARDLVVAGAGSLAARSDPRRVSQILAHLLTNAISYTPEGGRVVIGVEREPGAIHITVSDNGMGVNAADGDRIYERYYRSRDAERAGVRGLGLGLYVVREIAGRAGGRVWHEPGPDGGTTFHVLLPDRAP